MAEDHPRRCGENVFLLTLNFVPAGSPPQVRGKLYLPVGGSRHKGITPAGAGKTRYPRRRNRNRQDHPRRCGENRADNVQSPFPLGSPPQVRGKLTPAAVDQYGNGITPAGAGKTNHPQGFNLLRRDHPRRCGENSRAVYTADVRQGSPPQVRGKRVATDIFVGNKGITPAGAGKTFVTFSGSCFAWDHPRRCGENNRMNYWAIFWIGSPPQVRGKLCCLR